MENAGTNAGKVFVRGFTDQLLSPEFGSELGTGATNAGKEIGRGIANRLISSELGESLSPV